MSRKQSASEPPLQQMVSCAVLPPKLPAGMAPPTGVGAAEAFGWDEALNYQHNNPIAPNTGGGSAQDTPRRKSFLKKMGLTGERTKLHDDMPPFIMRQIPYDTWRKHYAKDADGNYRGSHAPAADCLLKPDDVKKWRLGEPKTVGDRWTRGSEALPVYAEIKDTPLPSYDAEAPPVDGMVINDDRPQPNTAQRGGSIPEEEHDMSYADQPPAGAPGDATPLHDQHSTRMEIADGKTAQQIIEEAKAKNAKQKPGKMTWKQKMQKGVEMVSMGA